MRHRAFLALLLGGAFAAPAAAQEAGVFVDPDSPAGKEYAIPLDDARRQASGRETTSGGQDHPLFGVGIEPADAHRSRADDGSPRDGGAPGSNGSGDRNEGGRQADSATSTSVGGSFQGGRKAAVVEAAAGGTSSGVLTAGIGAAVLLAGLLGGLGLRRLLRS